MRCGPEEAAPLGRLKVVQDCVAAYFQPSHRDCVAQPRCQLIIFAEYIADTDNRFDLFGAQSFE
jgi:hypothetical protein